MLLPGKIYTRNTNKILLPKQALKRLIEFLENGKILAFREIERNILVIYIPEWNLIVMQDFDEVRKNETEEGT